MPVIQAERGPARRSDRVIFTSAAAKEALPGSCGRERRDLYRIGSIRASTRPPAEGDGWVNWSEMATLAGAHDAIARTLNRLLPKSARQEAD